ncbi:MAG: glycoside hydrolase superfamily [Monoraphidium minutum]|nr:MAG: glycoside hydrolase superfamily [Monoraphidium minutum]
MRRTAMAVAAGLLVLGLAGVAQAQGSSRLAPFLLPGCSIMFEPGAACNPKPTPVDVGCCPVGFACAAGGEGGERPRCLEKPAARQTFAAGAVALGGACGRRVLPGNSCGGADGPEEGACCPDGFKCLPAAPGFGDAEGGSGGGGFTCQADAVAPLLMAASVATVSTTATATATATATPSFPSPTPPLPSDACACRVDKNNTRVPAPCPSPWDHAAGGSRVPPRLIVDAKGALVREAAGGGKPRPAAMRGANWFGWEGGQRNFDGLWAYCDDNSTQCRQDGEVPPPDSIGWQAQEDLQLSYWKRRMTSDFATVTWRLRLLGFNALRVPFSFEALGASMADHSFFPACVNDPDEFIALNKTLDPQFLSLRPRSASAPLQLPPAHAYAGMPHPPPPVAGQPAACGRAWSAPFLGSYDSAAGRGEFGSELRLTQCNWYLPQGPSALGIHRFLWQVQYLVSQGFYVILDYHPIADEDPNIGDPALFAANWRALWSALAALPDYESRLRGRLIADLVNEASKYGCQWDRACPPKCAKGSELLGAATAAIRSVDASVIVAANGMGQDGAGGCAGAYPGFNWGDGFVTDAAAIQQYRLSDPSFLFKYPSSDVSARQRLLAPHPYPTSITTVPQRFNEPAAARARWALSWGGKARGRARLSDETRAPRAAVILGEFGVRDDGDNADSNADTTVWSATDRAWLSNLAKFSKSQLGAQASWFFWSWNANSGDTRGLVGPQTTWREVQWTKVRALAGGWGLRPWFCDAAPRAWGRKYACGAPVPTA